MKRKAEPAPSTGQAATPTGDEDVADGEVDADGDVDMDGDADGEYGDSGIVIGPDGQRKRPGGRGRKLKSQMKGWVNELWDLKQPE